MTSDGYVWKVMCGGVRSITGGLHKAAPPYVRCHPMCAEASWTSMGRADNDVCPATPRKSWENLEKITRKHDEPDDPTPTHECRGLRRRQVGRRCVRLCADLTVPAKTEGCIRRNKNRLKNPTNPTTRRHLLHLKACRGVRLCFRRQVGVERYCVRLWSCPQNKNRGLASGRRVSGWFEKIFYISDPAITVNRWPKR